MARRAIEALRSGVPNRDVVRQLGVFQGDVTQRFRELILEVEQALETGDESPRSIVISGTFGAGKSHLLEYLRHEAIEHGCVCSQVVISKETPLFDPLKLLRAAVETATVRGKAGRAVPEILFTLERTSQQFVRLFQWAHQQPRVGDRIAALLKIVDELPPGAEEVLDKVAWEWSGYPMKVGDIRAALKDIGQHTEYQVKTMPQKELGARLWRFLPGLFHAAGYSGWVVLVDEVELILRYGKLQRAKSYAQLARLAGVARGFKVCGILPVFAVTGEFGTEADRKGDADIPQWLRERARPGDTDLARDTEAGMKLLKKTRALRPAQDDELTELKERVRRLHSQAFRWEAPPTRQREMLSTSPVREHIKSWIAEWDMMLLYPDYRPEIVIDEVVHDFSEDRELSREGEPTGGAEE
jgi:hypothetical protein